MRLHSKRYSSHRDYYKIENGNHVDSYFDLYRQKPSCVRPILPCYWAAFVELEEWVEDKGDDPPPISRTVSHPTPEGTAADANNSSISQEDQHSPQGAPGS